LAQFRQQLSSRTIRALIYNSQAVTSITKQMQELASQNGIAIVAVTETMPGDKSYQEWMVDQLVSLRQALGG
jgi:zinc/manganese transport system substrate-binding protein